MGKKYTLEYENSPLGGILDRQLFLATDEWKNKLATIKDVEIIIASTDTEPTETTTLQTAYDNSTSPQIITKAVNGALILKNGSDYDADTVLNILNKSGSPVFTVTGNGLIVGQLSWNNITNKPTTASGYGITDVPAGFAAIANLLTNVNGRVFTTFTVDTSHMGEPYPYTLIVPTSGSMDLIKAQTYLKYMLGTTYVPTFNYDFPKNIYFMDSSGSVWKPQYNATIPAELRIYKMPETYVTLGGAQTITGTKTFTSLITGSISGNAGTVTNGVYTIGDQVISGAKTFTQDVTIGSTTVNWTLDAAADAVFNIQASDGSTYYLPYGTTDTRRIATWEDVSQLASIGAEIIDLTGVV